MLLLALYGTVLGFEPVKLPNGVDFITWEKPLRFTHTYHVAQNHPEASDDNPGTNDLPWRTINKAAQVLQPGERVLIHNGTYREWVKPARGGISADNMISYEAAYGEEVVLKGSDIWEPNWTESSMFKYSREYNKPERYPHKIWEAKLNGSMFEGANVFCLQNFQGSPEGGIWKSYASNDLRRGQIFLNGIQLEQVNGDGGQFIIDMLISGNGGKFWVEDNGMTIHLTMPGHINPQGQKFEITTREQVFAPIKRGLDYICVKGLKIFHSANGVPIPGPQRGALSAAMGRHWIIEDCEIGYANTIGIDIGGQDYGYGTSHGVQGYHIIRRCNIHHCGVTAIAGWHNLPNESLLIEDNLFADNCWMPITDHYETAGVKIHQTQNSIIRRNVFLRTKNTASLWLDGEIFNTRITQNLFYGLKNTPFGHVFLEVNLGPNLIDNNLILNSEKHGFYEHDSERCVLLQNLIADCNGAAVYMKPGEPTRRTTPYQIPAPHLENEHRVFANMISSSNGQYIHFPNKTSRSDNNLFGIKTGESFSFDAKVWINSENWNKQGYDANSTWKDFDVVFDSDKLTLSVKSKDLKTLPVYQAVEKFVPGFEILPGKWRPVRVKGDENVFRLRTEKECVAPPTLAPVAKLLTKDLLGNARTSSEVQVGPVLNMPLDGTPINVDPRNINSRK
jgi:hypothetical protein